MRLSTKRAKILGNALFSAVVLFALASFGNGGKAWAADPISALPYHLENGFILIDGQVDGTRGVFMLDTGMPFRILLNRHYVPLNKGVDVRRGSVASGQAMIIQSHAGAHSIALAGGARISAASGARFIAPETVLSGDFGFIEPAVSPRFLGFVGWGFLKDYVFVIDYDKRAIPLYPLRRDGTSSAPSPDQSAVAAIIEFTPSSPIVPFELHARGVALPSILDTGGHERLAAPAEIWARLNAGGSPLVSKKDGDDELVSIAHASYRTYSFDLPDMEKVVGDKTLVTLGYPFLRNFRSTWNPAKGTVTLARK
jgi:hypothetical protein